MNSLKSLLMLFGLGRFFLVNMNDASMLVDRQPLNIDLYFGNSREADCALGALHPCKILKILPVVK